MIRNGDREPDWEALRRMMVDEQVRNRGIRDAGVLNAMTKIPRHEFVPQEERLRAYDDAPLPIGYGQTISQPYIVGFMTELLDLKPDHKVLEVGTGSGYQTAILAEIVREVFTLDVLEPHVESAMQRLARLGYTNVRFRVYNGYFGWPEAAPFDRIMVTAATPRIPDALVEQLKVGCKMVIPVGEARGEQMLKEVVKKEPFRMDIRDVAPVRFVPLVEKQEEI